MVKYRQPIRAGQHGRDIKAVKDGLKRMKVQGSGRLSKDDKAGKTFVALIKKVQKSHKLKADGIYGPKTHAIIAKHFSLFDNWRYRTAKIRKPPKPPLPSTAQTAAKRLLELHQQGKYRDDRGTCLVQIQAAASGRSVRNAAGQLVYLNAKMLRALVYLIDIKGLEVGTFSICSDHSFDSPRGHAGGFATDISSINGVSVTSGNAKPHVITLLNDLRSAGKEGLVPWQLISGGYANHSDSDCRARCVPSAGFYGEPTLSEHENHVHMGF